MCVDLSHSQTYLWSVPTATSQKQDNSLVWIQFQPLKFCENTQWTVWSFCWTVQCVSCKNHRFLFVFSQKWIFCGLRSGWIKCSMHIFFSFHIEDRFSHGCWRKIIHLNVFVHCFTGFKLREEISYTISCQWDIFWCILQWFGVHRTLVWHCKDICVGTVCFADRSF